MGVIVSYFKVVTPLLDNYNSLPTDVLELLNDVMTSADSKFFSEYNRIVQFLHKRKTKVSTPRDYVEYTEKKYCTLY